jgi:CrcB protein
VTTTGPAGSLKPTDEGGAVGDDGPVLPIDPDLAPRRGRARPDVIAVIALGGVVGASARFELAEALPTAPGHFPWATFWTNLSGSFMLGFLLVLLIERFPPTRYLRPFLATGIIGAFTTMSTYAVETAVLIKDDHAAVGLLYGIGSLVAGLLLAYAGIVLARLTPARHQPEHP